MKKKKLLHAWMTTQRYVTSGTHRIRHEVHDQPLESATGDERWRYAIFSTKSKLDKVPDIDTTGDVKAAFKEWMEPKQHETFDEFVARRGLFYVITQNEGSTPDECTCPDYMRDGFCKHGLARLYKEKGESIIPIWVKTSIARMRTRGGSICSKGAAGTNKNYRSKRTGPASMTYTEVNVPRSEGRERADTSSHGIGRTPFELPTGNVWLRCCKCRKWRPVEEDLEDMEDPSCSKMGVYHHSGKPCFRFCVRCGLCNFVCTGDPEEVILQRLDYRTDRYRDTEPTAANAANATSGTSAVNDGASDEASSGGEVLIPCSTSQRQPKRTRSRSKTLPPSKKRRIPPRAYLRI